MPGKDELDREFFAIANDMAAAEANAYLDKRLAAVDLWVKRREKAGEPADLRTLVLQILHEPNERGPVIVALAAALWRLRAIQKGIYGDNQQ